VITFSDDPAGARVNMAHSHVSEYEYKGVKEGWPKILLATLEGVPEEAGWVVRVVDLRL